MKVMMTLGQDPQSADFLRCQTLANLLARSHRLDNVGPGSSLGTEELLLPSLNKLVQKGQISFLESDGGIREIWFVPSMESKREVWSSLQSGPWDEKLAKKQRKAFRKTEGALFRLPLENEDQVIEAFITDWSPFPAAAMVAIHRDHPLALGVERKSADFFTGHYVRHPLSGDLLPVWVIDWVKPEFGTGAVIINPAHSQADLDLARKMGFPIRFGLAPQEVSSNSKTWPQPPVIKSGFATRTGPFDGLDYADAAQQYFQTLSEHGFAKAHTDLGTGSWCIGTFQANEEGSCFFNPLTNEFSSVGESLPENPRAEIQRVSLKPGSVFKSIAGSDDQSPDWLIAPAGEAGSTLLLARLLFYDLKQRPLEPKTILPVQKVQQTKACVDARREVLALASLFAAPIDQAAVIKQQILDQIERFESTHGALLKNSLNLPLTSEAAGCTPWGKSSKLKSELESMKLNLCFSTLYALQKQLKSLSPERAVESGLLDYFMFAYILADYPFPEGIDFSHLWKSIS